MFQLLNKCFRCTSHINILLTIPKYIMLVYLPVNNLPHLILAEINQIHFLTSSVCSLSLHGLSDFLL